MRTWTKSDQSSVAAGAPMMTWKRGLKGTRSGTIHAYVAFHSYSGAWV